MKRFLFTAALVIFLARSVLGQTTTYQGVVLKPGDVINFHQGVATTGKFQTYGHSALFLGTDAETGKLAFLDFSVTKGTAGEVVQGTTRPFRGRILAEQEFLDHNAKGHESFDVFRLKDPSKLDQKTLLQEAKRIAATGSWGTSDVCSSAVASVVAKATGSTIDIKTPNGFEGGPFQRHPQLTGKTINMQAAIKELKSTSDKIVGTWRGGMTQSDGASYNVVMRLDSKGGGTTTYSSLSCSGSLSGGPNGGGSFTYSETITSGRATPQGGGCLDGTITVRLLDDKTLSISWNGSWQGQAVSASGKLKKD